MNSTAEPTLGHKATMEDVYRLQRHIYDVTRRYYLLGRDLLLDGLDVPSGGAVLEIGCGTGRNIVGVAQRYPTAGLYGLDVSEEMLKSAQRNLTSAGLEAKVCIACVDATNFDAEICFGRAKFDRVFFSYTLSMIPDWQKALLKALAVLAPNGELHIVDFGQCSKLPKLFQIALFKWLKLFHVQPRGELVAALNELAASRSMTVAVKSVYRDYAWLAVVKKTA